MCVRDSFAKQKLRTSVIETFVLIYIKKNEIFSMDV